MCAEFFRHWPFYPKQRSVRSVEFVSVVRAGGGLIIVYRASPTFFPILLHIGQHRMSARNPFDYVHMVHTYMCMRTHTRNAYGAVIILCAYIRWSVHELGNFGDVLDRVIVECVCLCIFKELTVTVAVVIVDVRSRDPPPRSIALQRGALCCCRRR